MRVYRRCEVCQDPTAVLAFASDMDLPLALIGTQNKFSSLAVSQCTGTLLNAFFSLWFRTKLLSLSSSELWRCTKVHIYFIRQSTCSCTILIGTLLLTCLVWPKGNRKSKSHKILRSIRVALFNHALLVRRELGVCASRRTNTASWFTEHEFALPVSDQIDGTDDTH